MRIFRIDSQYFLKVCLMGLINQRLGYLPSWQLPLDALSNHHMQAQPRRQQDAGPSIPEKYSWEFELIEEESELEEGFKHGESLVFVHHNHWVDGVSMFQCVFDKALSVIYPAADLIGCGQSGLLETSRQKADVLALLHQLLQVLVVDGLYTPQLQDSTSNREVENEPASQTNDVSQWALLDRVHEHEEAETQDTVRMDTKDASILLGDDLLIDDFEVVEVLDGEEVLVDEVDVKLAPPKGQLQDDHHQQSQEEVQVQCKDTVGQDEDRHMKCKLCSCEQQQRNDPLVLAEEAFFLCLIDHQHCKDCSITSIYYAIQDSSSPGRVQSSKPTINNFK